jgi:hypothetical protein
MTVLSRRVRVITSLLFLSTSNCGCFSQTTGVVSIHAEQPLFMHIDTGDSVHGELWLQVEIIETEEALSSKRCLFEMEKRGEYALVEACDISFDASRYLEESGGLELGRFLLSLQLVQSAGVNSLESFEFPADIPEKELWNGWLVSISHRVVDVENCQR